MKNLVLGLSLILSANGVQAAVNCDKEAVQAVKAVYAISDKSKGSASLKYIRTLTDESLGYEVKEYNVFFDVNGGTGVWIVQAIPSLNCMISNVKLDSVD